MRAGEGPNEHRGKPLNGITARLAAPFAGGEIEGHLFVRKPFEGDARLADAQRFTPRRNETKTCIDAMGTAGEKLEALSGVCRDFRFRKDASSAGNDRVRADNEGVVMR